MASKIMKDKSKIPQGAYCYDENGTCPYWSIRFPKSRTEYSNGEEYLSYKEQAELQDDQCCGYCSFLDQWDWDEGGELWDQCKECGINDYDEERE